MILRVGECGHDSGYNLSLGNEKVIHPAHCLRKVLDISGTHIFLNTFDFCIFFDF